MVKNAAGHVDSLSRKGKGRPKGSRNRTTADVREMIEMVARKNAAKLDSWLARIGRKDPARAMELYLRMIEYHIPKLTRTEIVKPAASLGRVIDSSQLTAEQREQLRQMILATPNILEPMGLSQAQVIDNTVDSE